MCPVATNKKSLNLDGTLKNQFKPRKMNSRQVNKSRGSGETELHKTQYCGTEGNIGGIIHRREGEQISDTVRRLKTNRKTTCGYGHTRKYKDKEKEQVFNLSSW